MLLVPGQAGPLWSSAPQDCHSCLGREQTLLLVSAPPSVLRRAPFSISRSHSFLEGESSPEDHSSLQVTTSARWLGWTEMLPQLSRGCRYPPPLECPCAWSAQKLWELGLKSAESHGLELNPSRAAPLVSLEVGILPSFPLPPLSCCLSSLGCVYWEPALS